MVGRNVKVRNVVVRVCDSLDGGVINSVLHKHGCKWCARRYRLANDHVPPRVANGAPAKAPTGHLRVKGDLRFQAENFSDGDLIHSLEL
jgi:hypothetical protein